MLFSNFVCILCDIRRGSPVGRKPSPPRLNDMATFIHLHGPLYMAKTVSILYLFLNDLLNKSVTYKKKGLCGLGNLSYVLGNV